MPYNESSVRTWNLDSDANGEHLQEELDRIVENFNALKTSLDGLVIPTVPPTPPVGAVIAWHKSFPNTPALDAGWVECNGQALNDSDSPYHGQTIPNLNGAKESWNSKGSFLRGAASSGDFEDDQIQGHHHTTEILSTFYGDLGVQLNTGVSGSAQIRESAGVLDPSDDGINDTPRTGTETHPVNMSVVWVMRVK